MKKKSDQLRYIAYIRKSEEREDRQELSHESQENEIKKHFPNLNIIKWMKPESKSAFKPGRDIFNEMMEMLERGEADGIVSWHPNRLSRNEVDSARITFGLRTFLKDLKFCSYTFQNSAEGIMMLQMVMNQSQYESSKQGRDVKRGMNQKAMNGERPGQVPQGYIKVPVLDENGSLVKTKDKIVTKTDRDPERYELVSKMWSMLLSGSYNASHIRTIANEEWGYLTRKTPKTGGVPLTPSMIYKIFNNPFYAGYISHNGELHKGSHVAMITLNQFDYAQTLLGSKGAPRNGVHQYAYSGLIKCGVCSCAIVGKTNVKFIKSEGRNKVYVHYYCTRRSEQRPCNQNVYTSLEKLDAQIYDELGKYEILPEFRDLALDILKRSNKTEIQDRSAIYRTQQQKRDDIQSRLDKLVDMRTRDLLDDDEYAAQKDRLVLERRKIDETLRLTEKRADDWMGVAEQVFDFATNARTKFKEGSLANKREILRTLGSNFLLKDGQLTLEPNEWLTPIAELYSVVEKRYLKVRTNKKASLTDGSEAMLPIIESWRARRDSNPRHPA